MGTSQLDLISQKMVPAKRYYTTKELSDYLSIPENVILRYMELGVLEGTWSESTKTFRIDIIKVELWLEHLRDGNALGAGYEI